MTELAIPAEHSRTGLSVVLTYDVLLAKAARCKPRKRESELRSSELPDIEMEDANAVAGTLAWFRTIHVRDR